jgi:hypothetical protein
VETGSLESETCLQLEVVSTSAPREKIDEQQIVLDRNEAVGIEVALQFNDVPNFHHKYVL